MTDTTYLIRKHRGGAAQFALEDGTWASDLFVDPNPTQIRPDALTFRSSVIAWKVARDLGGEVIGVADHEQSDVTYLGSDGRRYGRTGLVGDR